MSGISRCLLVLCILFYSEAASGQFVSMDADADGVADILLQDASRPGTLERGEVLLVSGDSGNEIHRFSSQNANHLFGLSATAIADFTLDGVLDIAVAAPGEGFGTHFAGRIYLYDGVTGDELFVLKGAPWEFLSWRVAPARDLNADGVPDIIVHTVTTWEEDFLVDGWRLFCGQTGRTLGDGIMPEFWWPEFATGIGMAARQFPTADVDGDGLISAQDVLLVASDIGQSVAPASPTDIVVDGTVNGEDLSAVSGTMGLASDTFLDVKKNLAEYATRAPEPGSSASMVGKVLQLNQAFGGRPGYRFLALSTRIPATLDLIGRPHSVEINADDGLWQNLGDPPQNANDPCLPGPFLELSSPFSDGYLDTDGSFVVTANTDQAVVQWAVEGFNGVLDGAAPYEVSADTKSMTIYVARGRESPWDPTSYYVRITATVQDEECSSTDVMDVEVGESYSEPPCFEPSLRGPDTVVRGEPIHIAFRSDYIFSPTGPEAGTVPVLDWSKSGIPWASLAGDPDHIIAADTLSLSTIVPHALPPIPGGPGTYYGINYWAHITNVGWQPPHKCNPLMWKSLFVTDCYSFRHDAKDRWGRYEVDNQHRISTFRWPPGGTTQWEVLDGASKIEVLSSPSDADFEFNALERGPVLLLVKYSEPTAAQRGCDDVYEIVGLQITGPCDVDEDGDGVLSCCEEFLGTNPFVANDWSLMPDEDNDGLADVEETCYGTDPGFFDTDQDGLSDGAEVDLGLDPNSPDSDGDTIVDGDDDFDGDGVSNAIEHAMGLDPGDPDTDGDGVTDGVELARGTNALDPTDANDVPTSDELVTVEVKVGDHSGSESERWRLVIGQAFALDSGAFGVVKTATATLRVGRNYPITLQHLGSKDDLYDYDYTAVLTKLSGSGICVVDDNSSLLGIHQNQPISEWSQATATLRIPELVGPKCGVSGDSISINFDPPQPEASIAIQSGAHLVQQLSAPDAASLDVLALDVPGTLVAEASGLALLPGQEPVTKSVTLFGDPQITGPSNLCGGESAEYTVTSAGIVLDDVTWSVVDPDGLVLVGASVDTPGAAVMSVLAAGGLVTLQATVGTSCEPPIAIERSVGIPEVLVAPDPSTHVDATSGLTILPGDAELLLVDVDGGNLSDAYLAITDPSIAGFETAIPGSLASAIPLDAIPAEGAVRVIGVASGSASIELRLGSPDGNSCGGLIAVTVGGAIAVEYSEPATFTPPLPTAGSPSRIDPVIWDAADVLPDRNAVVNIRVTDAYGRPKPNKVVSLESARGYTQFNDPIAARGPIIQTDVNGEASLGLAANQTELEQLAGIGPDTHWLVDDIIVLAGEPVYRAAGLPPADLLALAELVGLQTHTFTGHELKFDGDVKIAEATTVGAGVSFRFPVMNKIQLAIVETNLEARQYVPMSHVEPGVDLTTILVWDPQTGQYVTETVQPEVPFLTATRFDESLFNFSAQFMVPRLQEVLEPEMDLLYTTYNFQVSVEFDPDGSGTGSRDRPILSAGAVAAELALGFIPGADLIDVIRYGVFENIDDDGANATNYLIAAAATAGLAADAGYLTGVGGVAANAVTTGLKVIIKYVDPQLMRLLFRLGANTVDSADKLITYLSRFPKPPSFSIQSPAAVGQWVTNMVTSTVNQWNALLNSPIGLSPASVSKGVDAARRNLRKTTASPESALGFAAVVEHVPSGASRLDELGDALRAAANSVDEVADESVNDVVASVGRVLGRRSASSGPPDPEDIKWVDEALQAAARPANPRLAALAQPHVGPGKVFKSVEEVEVLRRLPADALSPAQRGAMQTFSLAANGATAIPNGTTMAKVITGEIAEGMIENLPTFEQKIRGLFTVADDVFENGLDASRQSKQAIIDTLRLDYPGSQHLPGSGYAVLEFPMTPSIRGTSKTPRTADYHSIDSSIEYVSEGASAPFTGAGSAASLNGKFVRELGTDGVPGGGPDVPIGARMTFRNADGSPNVATGGHGTSTYTYGGNGAWVPLVPDPAGT